MDTLLPKPAQQETGQYELVNGLKMYYEIHGYGEPLVLLHGGGSTIQSTFGRILPEFKKNHMVIAIELQAHGHTPDIDRPLSFEQDADDVATLLGRLQISKTDFMGFSNGGTTCLQMAIRHPGLVNKLVLASVTFKREGMQAGFWEGMQNASIENMPQPLQKAYLTANNDLKGLQAMFNKDLNRMLAFKNISDTDIQSIQAKTMVINGDKDVVRTEHAVELSRLLPHAELAVLPGGHGDYIGEICSANPESKIPAVVVTLIDEFLK